MGLGLSISSSEFTIKSLPTVTLSTPYNVQAQAGHLSSTLTWSGTSGNTFSIYRNTVNSHVDEVEIANNLEYFEFIDYDIPAGVEYFYWVKATLGETSSGYSNVANCVPYVFVPQSNGVNLSTPEGSWTLGTLFYSSTSTPHNAVLSFEGNSYIFNGWNWVTDPSGTISDDVVIVGSFIATSPSGSDWTFWDIVAP